MTTFEDLVQLNCFAADEMTRQQAAATLERDYTCEINCVEIDPSVQFAHHGRGCTIAAAKIAANAVIFQNVTIGSNQKFNLRTQQWEQVGGPVIGRSVIVADGAKVLGPIIIGDNSIVGAGTIVTKDVPANSVVYGVNQVKPRPTDYDLIYHRPFPNRSSIVEACEENIRRYEENY
ncbi:serine acetyltransferase [Lactiplantibacillus herbarum]|uniref:serine acetyltransferase n=1 Tax=Lactiplantibacillus herbarum TaxID=1670446 RepID=UPI00064F0124|nr:serine acetyltransferase [Lactiplantibacillus herbarum]